jgi:hypothetical protein
MRHDIAEVSSRAGSGSSGGNPSKGGGSGSDKSQKVKLIVAVAVLVVATGLIVWQSGLLEGAPTPLAAQPGAELDDDQNPDNPGEPPPKSNFSRQAQPIR